MSDISIQLYAETSQENPVAVMESSYRDFARMDQREIVENCLTGFKDHISYGGYQLILSDGVETIQRAYHPIADDDEQFEYGLRIMLSELIGDYRSKNHTNE